MTQSSVKNRFEVSTEGMRLLQEGRPLWQLVKELVSNSWDEPTVYECTVRINSSKRGLIEIQVEDNGCGFSDITDAFTLMQPTNKRTIADVRGRFNIGEKELLSTAYDGVIETVGKTVEFPHTGGRKVKSNKRTQGTLITVNVKGRKDEIQECVDQLVTFIPPTRVNYNIESDIANVGKLQLRTLLATTKVTLPTILSTTINEPMRNTKRVTKMHIYKYGNPNSKILSESKGRLFEMGIPVCEHQAPYDIDIDQKIPLPPNRDVVSDGYMQNVYAEVLNVTHDDLTDVTASSNWVTKAIESKRTRKATVKAVMKVKLGDNAVLLNPFDKEANERAYASGKALVDAKTLSPAERTRYKEEAGLQTTKFWSDKDGTVTVVTKVTKEMKEVESYTKWLAKKLLGIDIQVKFVHDSNSFTACYGSKVLQYNLNKLSKGFFKNSPTLEQTSLILHELSHDRGSELRSHGEDFVHELGRLGAVAVFKALETNPESDFVWWSSDKEFDKNGFLMINGKSVMPDDYVEPLL